MIIFLDFDGVISSPRAYGAQEEIEDFHIRWLDPIACKLVAKLCRKFSAQIVVSSTWRNFGFDHVMKSLAAHGLDVYVHKDWRTGEGRNRDSRYDRPDEIDMWLGDNGNPPFIILDDDSFYWTEEQQPWVVKTSAYDGMGLFHYEEAIHKLETLCQTSL